MRNILIGRDDYLKVTEVAKSAIAISAFVKILFSFSIFIKHDIFWIDVHFFNLFELLKVLNLGMSVRGRAGSVRFSI